MVGHELTSLIIVHDNGTVVQCTGCVLFHNIINGADSESLLDPSLQWEEEKSYIYAYKRVPLFNVKADTV